MKHSIALFILLFSLITGNSQNPVGKWQKISHTTVYDGNKIDSHTALLKQRPCAAKIIYEINADGSFRLNASSSGCDEQYKSVQEKIYSKTKWKLEGNKISTSSTNFAVGQSYIITFSGNQMTWTGTEGQGVIVYQKI